MKTVNIEKIENSTIDHIGNIINIFDVIFTLFICLGVLSFFSAVGLAIAFLL